MQWSPVHNVPAFWEPALRPVFLASIPVSGGDSSVRRTPEAGHPSFIIVEPLNPVRSCVLQECIQRVQVKKGFR